MLAKVIVFFMFTIMLYLFGGLTFAEFTTRLGKTKSFLITVAVNTILSIIFLLIPLPLTRFAVSSTEMIVLSWLTVLAFPLWGYWVFGLGWSIAPSTVEKEMRRKSKKK
jgi:Na+/melibiose symporter-like transporter